MLSEVLVPPSFKELPKNPPTGTKLGFGPIPDRWEKMLKWCRGSHEFLVALEQKDLSRGEAIVKIDQPQLITIVYLRALIHFCEFPTQCLKRVDIAVGTSSKIDGLQARLRFGTLSNYLNPQWGNDVFLDEMKRARTVLNLPLLGGFKASYWLEKFDQYCTTFLATQKPQEPNGKEVSSRLMIPQQVRDRVDTLLKIIVALDQSAEFPPRVPCTEENLTRALFIRAIQDTPAMEGSLTRLHELLGVSPTSVGHRFNDLFKGTTIVENPERMKVLRAALFGASTTSDLDTLLEKAGAALCASPAEAHKEGIIKLSGVDLAEDIVAQNKLVIPELLTSRVSRYLKIISQAHATPEGQAPHLTQNSKEIEMALFVRAAQEVPAIRGVQTRLSELLGMTAITINNRLDALFQEIPIHDNTERLNYLRAALLSVPCVGEFSKLQLLCRSASSAIDLEKRVRRLGDDDEAVFAEDTASYDGMAIYRNQAFNRPLLTREEETELAKKIKRGGEEGSAAREAMILSNVRLVGKIAEDYFPILPMEDLINEGNIGLMRAIDRFDPAKGKLSTYASWWIEQKILRAIANQSRTVRLPVHMFEKVRQYDRIVEELTEELGVAPDDDQVAEKLGWKSSAVENARAYGHVQVSSLDASVSTDADSITFLDRYSEATDEDVDDKVIQSESLIAAMEAFCSPQNGLDERERKIIALRFGLTKQEDDESRPLTLGEIGKQLGVSGERIRQMQNIALAKLRSWYDQMNKETA